MCGPMVPDVGLLAQAGSRMQWSQEKGAFLAESLPACNRGRCCCRRRHRRPGLPSPASRRSRANAIACLCMDVSGQDVVETIAAGMGHMELIKRFTKLGKSACQGRMCQTAAVHLCHRSPVKPSPRWVPPSPGLPRRPSPLARLPACAIIPCAERRCTISMSNWALSGWTWASGSGRAITVPGHAGRVREAGISRSARTCGRHRRQHPGKD